MKPYGTIVGLLLAALILVMGLATFVEQARGASFAQEHIYDAWWFGVLWCALTVCSCLYMAKRKLWRRASVCLLHLSLLIILAGAATTALTGDEGLMHLRADERESHYVRADGQRVPLPFSLTLRQFEVVYYPGTQAPQDFVSRVTAPSGDEAVISMNHILKHRGYRFCQSSFDPDLRGTVLSVRYDPYGTPVTYLGYALLGLSMMVVLLARGETFRRLLRSPLLKRGLILLVLVSLGWGCLEARTVPTITADRAERAARMQVVYNDRVAPFSTLAHDFLNKIYGKDSYKGLSPEQVVYGWLARPDAWQHEPMIRIKDAVLCRELGVDGEYAALAQLFDGSDYKLSRLMTTAGRQPDKAMRELDEKVGLILMLTGGQLVKPVPDGVARISDARVEAEIYYNKVPFCKLLFMACFLLGLLSFAYMLYRTGRPSRRRHDRLWQCFGLCLCAVLLFHLSGYALHWYVAGRMPLGNGYETMQFLALLLLTFTLVLHRRFRFVLPFGFLLSGFALLVAWLGQRNPQITPLVPVLSSPLLSAHVCLIMTAYALLAFMMLNAIYALAFCSRHADRQQGLALLSRLMLFPAVFFLGAGIFLGAVWANVSWGKYWSWDPKETWALITFLIYAVPLHAESLPAFSRPKLFHAYVLLAFLTVLMTYFGVNYFLGGMHAYA